MTGVFKVDEVIFSFLISARLFRIFGAESLGSVAAGALEDVAFFSYLANKSSIVSSSEILAEKKAEGEMN